MPVISNWVRGVRSLSNEAHAEVAQKWVAPSIDGAADQGFLTASRLQDLQKQAYDEAWEAGHAEGIKAGAIEVQQRVDRFDELLCALARPFERLDESVEKQLVELAMTVVQQLFRRELQTDPGHVVGVVREAIKILPGASRDVSVYLHPEDAQLVKERLTPTDGERAWSIVEDPLISRGGCRVRSENSQVDAQTEKRLSSIINRITGDDRQ